jgi:phosphoribosylanthranilate isomerase
VRPYAVDVISGVEDEHHRKVPERVRAFVASARSA